MHAFTFTDRQLFLMRRVLTAQMTLLSDSVDLLAAHQHTGKNDILAARGELRRIAAIILDEEERRNPALAAAMTDREDE